MIYADKRFIVNARVFVAFKPTSRHPTSPGPTVPAKAVISSGLIPAFSFACLKASSITMFMESRCSLAAISGITPPNCACVLICDATTFAITSAVFYNCTGCFITAGFNCHNIIIISAIWSYYYLFFRE